MSLDTGRYQLYSTLKTASAHWDQTQTAWRDQVARDFAEQTWTPLEQKAKQVLSAIDRLGQIIVRARQECG
ncbi:MAG: hypothetical protein FJ271_07835 [Planctomycetes bacterium]|nr:hypothetical protein [Planctomycetota bacterium]